MHRKMRDSIPALVLEVIARVYELAERRTQPWYIDRATLNLGRPLDSVDSSIYYAEVSGWLVGAGEPPKSVAVTADGKAVGGVWVYLRTQVLSSLRAVTSWRRSRGSIWRRSSSVVPAYLRACHDLAPLAPIHVAAFIERGPAP
jgi:hypothetical protein